MKDLSSEKVLIINTGGTIGMRQTDHGYAPQEGYLLDELHKIDDLKQEKMPRWAYVEMLPLLDSSNISAKEWNRMADIIHSNYADCTGFVILHGTDTMSYTASALSYILKGIDKPVILTGSQIPLCEVRSDGRDNLITSMIIAAEGIACEVCLCFGGKLLRGNRSMKVSADRLVAFDSPNYPPLAEIGVSIHYHKSALQKPTSNSFEVTRFHDVPIGVLKVFPGIQFGLFESIITEKLSGVVIETFGAGNIPMGGDELLPIIKKAFNAGAIVTVCSQCEAGTVSLGTYEASNSLKTAGAVSGKDMTTEAAVTKLYYLFSLGCSSSEIKSLMEKNIVGELTE